MTTATTTLFSSASHLSIDARTRMIAALNASLADGIDLYGQLKLAHWNIKGPHFAALHPLFETLADEAAARNDELAERGVALGGLAIGTASQVAEASRLGEFTADATTDKQQLPLLVDGLTRLAVGLRAARDVAAEIEDTDTEDLLTGHITAIEKSSWMLSASLER